MFWSIIKGWQKKKTDRVQKIFGKSATEILIPIRVDHSKTHSKNAFCSNAGPEEMKHLKNLLNALTDIETAKLSDSVGIKFGGPSIGVNRETLEGVLDKADREDFIANIKTNGRTR